MKILLVSTKTNLKLFNKQYDNLLLVSDNYDYILNEYWKNNKFDKIYGLGGGCVADISKYLKYLNGNVL